MATSNEYEFALHAGAVARRRGILEGELASLCEPLAAGQWSAADQALLGFVDELAGARQVSDETCRALREVFGEPEVIELTLLCGFYGAISQLVALARPPADESPRARERCSLSVRLTIRPFWSVTEAEAGCGGTATTRRRQAAGRLPT